MFPIGLTVTQLRNALQLPERPYEDPYIYDGTSYYDFSHRELCTLLVASGTASGSPFLFRLGTDFQITAGTIDWTPPGGVKPDLNTRVIYDYTYSKMGGDVASTCVANALVRATHDLGSAYPYGSSASNSSNGYVFSYDAAATYCAVLAAAEEACYALSTTEIDIAQKARRGSIVTDDSKKTSDWLDSALSFNTRYKRSLIIARGMIRSFGVASQNPDRSVFGPIGSFVFDGDQQFAPYAENSGLLY